MVEIAGDDRFGQELLPLLPVLVDVGAQLLDGDGSVDGQLRCGIDGADAPFTDDLQQPVIGVARVNLRRRLQRPNRNLATGRRFRDGRLRFDRHVRPRIRGDRAVPEILQRLGFFARKHTRLKGLLNLILVDGADVFRRNRLVDRRGRFAHGWHPVGFGWRRDWNRLGNLLCVRDGDVRLGRLRRRWPARF